MSNMWILHQFDEKKNNKYMCSLSYDDIMSYIMSYDDVHIVEEFHYVSHDIHFKIHIGEVIKYGE